MATIQGNLTALLDAAAELIPPVRNGQNARVTQDEMGGAFATVQATLTQDYDPANANASATSWVYGITLEGSSVDTTENPVFVSWASASNAREAALIVGQTLRFPRGARRVFLRSATGTQNVAVSWHLDRFATKSSASPFVGLPPPQETQVESVEQEGQLELSTNYLPLDGRKHVLVEVLNASTDPTTVEVVAGSRVIASWAAPAGIWTYKSIGPGLELPIVLPHTMLFVRKLAAGTGLYKKRSRIWITGYF